MLNNRQRLLLAQVMYVGKIEKLKEEKSFGKHLENLRELVVNGTSKISGGLNKQDALDTIDEILKDKELSSLKIVRGDGPSQASIVLRQSQKGKKDQDIAVFRGTGGDSKGWYDNGVVLTQEMSPMQKDLVGRFNDYAGDNYNITYLIGHSQGGNRAQMYAALHPEKIEMCYSFDGNGFSPEFVEKYSKNIASVKSKIVNISSYDDYVNGNGCQIAGMNLYIKSNLKPLMQHSTKALLDKNLYSDYNAGKFDIKKVANKPSDLMQAIFTLNNLMMDKSPKEREEFGKSMGIVLKKTLGEGKKINECEKELKDIYNKYSKLIKNNEKAHKAFITILKEGAINLTKFGIEEGIKANYESQKMKAEAEVEMGKSLYNGGKKFYKGIKNLFSLETDLKKLDVERNLVVNDLGEKKLVLIKLYKEVENCEDMKQKKELICKYNENLKEYKEIEGNLKELNIEIEKGICLLREAENSLNKVENINNLDDNLKNSNENQMRFV